MHLPRSKEEQMEGDEGNLLDFSVKIFNNSLISVASAAAAVSIYKSYMPV